MIVPNTEIIEQAAKSYTNSPVAVRIDEGKELHTASAQVEKYAGLAYSEEFLNGYLFGLHVARTALHSSAPLFLANIKPDEVF